ncbi:hypothetical protein F5Y04DRAFT_279589 [Hypomontagnella monticulosa]|nr:hypothetical protein F5Y04DRAFT_279589 [Hypomontagnella monticulosa]
MKFSGIHTYLLLSAVPSALSATLSVDVRSIEENKAILDHVVESGLDKTHVITDETREAIAKDPVLMAMFTGSETALTTRGDEEMSKLVPRVDVGLPRSQWVTVPITCASCIIACMTTDAAARYTAGQTIHTLDVWRAIGVCGTTCVFSGSCTGAQAGTWQAQQPHDFPLDS